MIFHRMIDDTCGAVAVLFAFALMVLMLFTGLSIDYLRLSDIRSNLRRAADAAALAAVSKSAMIDNASDAEQIAHSQALAINFFKASPESTGVDLDNVTATVVRLNGELKVTVSYKAKARMMFGNLFGQSNSIISDNANAAASTPKYIDLYILVDSSTSMGIGAAAADQSLMHTTLGCTFACHINGTDATARAAGAVLRFDVIKSAITQILTTAEGLDLDTHVRIGLYSFATNFKTEIDITSDLAAAKTATNAMELSGYGAGTNVFEALKQVKSKIGPTGDGSSPGAPLTFVILATDGTGNATDNTDPASPDAGNWIYSPLFVAANPHAVPDPGLPEMDMTGLDPTWCDAIKSIGANMMTLETEYVISPLEASELRFDYIQNTLAPNLKANMEACATKASYNVSANSPAEIMAAMDTLFKAALTASPRLTN